MENEKKLELFKDLLATEAMLAEPDDWVDDGPDTEWIQQSCERLRAEVDRKEYEAWKAEYIETEYQRLKDLPTLITVRFWSDDETEYREICAQDQVGGMLATIDASDNLHFMSIGNATEEDLRQFIAECAYDEEYRDACFITPEERKARWREEIAMRDLALGQILQEVCSDEQE